MNLHLKMWNCHCLHIMNPIIKLEQKHVQNLKTNMLSRLYFWEV